MKTLRFSCVDTAGGFTFDYTLHLDPSQTLSMIRKDEYGDSQRITEVERIQKFVEGVLETLDQQAQGDLRATSAKLMSFFPTPRFLL